MQKKDIYEDNIKIKLKDGGELIGPGPCPLTISDWMNFLMSLWCTYDNSLSQSKTWMYAGCGLIVATGTFALSIFIKLFQEIPVFLLAIIVYSTVFILINYTINFFRKIMDHSGKCRDEIYRIIYNIISGTYKESDIIRMDFIQTSKSIHIASQELMNKLHVEQ